MALTEEGKEYLKAREEFARDKGFVYSHGLWTYENLDKKDGVDNNYNIEAGKVAGKNIEKIILDW